MSILGRTLIGRYVKEESVNEIAKERRISEVLVAGQLNTARELAWRALRRAAPLAISVKGFGRHCFPCTRSGGSFEAELGLESVRGNDRGRGLINGMRLEALRSEALPSCRNILRVRVGPNLNVEGLRPQ